MWSSIGDGSVWSSMSLDGEEVGSFVGKCGKSGFSGPGGRLDESGVWGSVSLSLKGPTRLVEEVKVEATWGRTNLRSIFRPQVLLFQSHEIFSPGDGHLLVLEASSGCCGDVEEYCRMLPVALKLV